MIIWITTLIKLSSSSTYNMEFNLDKHIWAISSCLIITIEITKLLVSLAFMNLEDTGCIIDYSEYM